jgi:hypothetical protein
MGTVRAGGWSADWLVGWLAAVGTVVVMPHWQLSWTDERLPVAVLHGPCSAAEVATALAEVLASDPLGRLSIARHHPDGPPELTRNFGVDVFASRASIERDAHDGMLEASVTDLVPPGPEGLRHSFFDLPAQQGKTLHDRACAVSEIVLRNEPAKVLAASIEGHGRRYQANGLGLDARRLPGSGDKTGVWCDPASELMAFFALALFPARGGTEVEVRGWARRPGGARFTWPAWAGGLDRWAIDAMLDEVANGTRSSEVPSRHLLRRWSITALFTSRRQQSRGDDRNSGFGSLRLL